VLGLLLAATLVGAATLDRRTWPGLVGDESTYLMQAQSLAWDGDLAYTRADYDRFLAQQGRPPEGLILQSADGGRTLVYAKPAAYALFVAPFLRASPSRGAAVANALLLALAALASARALERRIGPAAALWVAAWIFASVAFAYVFWTHSDIFLMSLAALALALAYGGAPEARSWPWRWAIVGLLLGIVVVSRPIYAGLLLPAALAVPPERHRAGLAALAAGVAVLALVSAGASLATRGTWTSYAGERQSFDASTGFPRVDPPADDWRAQLARHGTTAWVKEETLRLGFDPRQTGWNVLYYLIGRHVGVLPYFLPLLLGLLAFRPGEGRTALLAAVLIAAAGLFYLRPFNFYGGGGAIANRYFLPIYPAFWFLAARPFRPLRQTLAVVAPILAAALAAPFLLPLWTAPRAYPIDPDGGYHHVSDFAQRWLPYETTLSHLKPAGQEDFLEHGLWVRLLTPGLHSRGARIDLDPGPSPGHSPGQSGDLLVGYAQPLAAVRMRLPPGAPEPARIWGISGIERLPRPEGGAALRLRLAGPRASHRMWWTDRPFYLYELRIEPPAGRGLSFQLLPEPLYVQR
jgi:hypothetical protein